MENLCTTVLKYVSIIVPLFYKRRDYSSYVCRIRMFGKEFCSEMDRDTHS